MRKTVLILAIMLTGLLTANNSAKKADIIEGVCSNWVEVDPGCSNHFWLCEDSYSSLADLEADAIRFSAGRCGIQ